MTNFETRVVGQWGLALAANLLLIVFGSPLQGAEPSASTDWKIGEPIVTYWFGPPLTDAVAKQMVDGGWNLVWCGSDQELDVANRHGLRALLYNPLFSPAVLDVPAEREKLDALIQRVRNHPALYCYQVVDEPSAQDFPALEEIKEEIKGQNYFPSSK